ncbi:serine/threonine-protein kinase [Cytophagales bacterium LB-30]|uniref:Serine/threonine-protein kinase n=1 Tax=Shiella aurantiaca TaxID=3058365 RepID=A0ABT8F9R6_9BACT|nr:serine/threonine-protein kinase [Shiella aurantiaca]MDN4166994.1 serine/threonine-protein kinase [Shiella aurantiaca]
MQQWDEISLLLEETLTLPAAEQQAFVNTRLSGQPELQQLLWSLVENATQAEQFFDHLQLEIAEIITQPEANPLMSFDQIGVYRIRKELGRGGMAVVYEAERNDGQFQQTVAIKVMQKSLATEEGALRFRVERQLLARLNHPNIARLYDGGTTEQGLPYIVMEKIEGVSLNRYLTDTSLSHEQRWDLFMEITEAVEYAHKNRIVHGDLKPENIWITPEGKVKLLDFGIATLLSEEENQAQALFTPDYASPEHWQGKPLLFASDIFQLGLLFLKINNRRNPLKGLLNKGSMMAHEVMDEYLSVVSLPTEPKALVSKCLAWPPEGRYAHASDLKQEIYRLKHHFPLEAMPSKGTYLAKKFVQRNAWKVGISAAFTLLFLIISGVYFININRQKQKAETEAAKAQAVSGFLVNLLTESDPYENLGQDVPVKELVKKALPQLEEGQLPDEVRISLLEIVGKIYHNYYEDAEALKAYLEVENWYRSRFDKVEEIPDFPYLLNSIAVSYRYLDSAEKATQYFEEAWQLRHVQVKQSLDSTSGRILNDYAIYYQENGDFTSSDSLLTLAIRHLIGSLGMYHTETATAYHNWGVSLLRRGLYAQADSILHHALLIRNQVLAKNHPYRLSTLHNMGRVKYYQKQYDSAIYLYSDVLQRLHQVFGEKGYTQWITLYNDLAFSFLNQNQIDSAKHYAELNLTYHLKFYGETHGKTAFAYNALAGIYRKENKTKQALVYQLKGLEGIAQSVGKNHYHYATFLFNTARLEKELGNSSSAKARLKSALAIRIETFGPDNPLTQEIKQYLQSL